MEKKTEQTIRREEENKETFFFFIIRTSNANKCIDFVTTLEEKKSAKFIL